MDLDSFLASPRWEILQIIAQKPSSPIEIASKINTTVSFVSQQLKLLEAAGLVKKERTGAVEKGKPRTIFSLAREIAYIVPLSKDFREKQKVELSKENKVVLKIWSIKDPRIQKITEKFFWAIHEHLEKINGIYICLKELLPKAYILSKEKGLTQKVNESLKRLGGGMDFQIIPSLSIIPKMGAEFFVPIYDPSHSFENDTVLKGGVKEDE